MLCRRAGLLSKSNFRISAQRLSTWSEVALLDKCRAYNITYERKLILQGQGLSMPQRPHLPCPDGNAMRRAALALVRDIRIRARVTELRRLAERTARVSCLRPMTIHPSTVIANDE